MSNTSPNENGKPETDLLADHGFKESSLFRSVYSDTNSQTLHHLIGHRTATWIPAAHQGDWSSYEGDLDDDFILDTLKRDPPLPIPSELRADQLTQVQEGKKKILKAPTITLPEGAGNVSSVFIHAEDLVIYRGSTFDFTRKNLTILARRLIVAPRPGEQLAQDQDHLIVFKTSGGDAGTSYISQTPASDGAANGADAQEIDTHIWESNIFIAPTQGGQGAEGNRGADGFNGGSIYCCASIVSLCGDDPKLKIQFVTKGQDGEQGQKGGKGGKGGNGLKYSSHSPWEPNSDKICGAKGGKGGTGGAGGSGGDAGNVILRTQPSPGTSQTGQSRFSNVTAFDFDIAGGSNGASGGKGEGGDGGEHGYSHPGPTIKDHDGWDGKKGDEGDQNKNDHNSKSGDLSQVLKDPDVGAFILAVSPAFLQMLIRRLSFEYDVLFSSFFEVQSDVAKTANRLRFEVSLKWANDLYTIMKQYEKSGGKWDTSNGGAHDDNFKAQQDKLCSLFGGDAWSNADLVVARTTLSLAFDKFLSLGSNSVPLEPATDTYNQSFRFLPNTSLTLNRLKQAASELLAVETFRKEGLQLVALNDRAAKKDSDQIQKCSEYVAKIDTTRSGNTKTLEDSSKKVEELKKPLNDLMQKVKGELKNIQPEWYEVNLTCQSAEKVLGAVASCLMFTPGAGEAFLAVRGGNAISVGSAAFSLFDTVDTNSGNISKDLIRGQFKSIESQITGKKLADEIGSWTESTNPKVMKTILLEQSRFAKLCDEYFPADQTQDAKNAFDKFVAQAQLVNTALVEHQKLLIEQAKAEAFYVQAQIVKNRLLQSAGNSNTVLTQLFLQVYDESYAEQKSRVVKFYLDAIRAIVALKLEPTTIAESLLALGCWDNVTGSLFNEVILPQLHAENDTLKRRDNQFAWSETTYKGFISKETHPSTFGYQRDRATHELKKVDKLRKFQLLIDSTNCFKILGIDLSSEMDVRMVRCWVVLEGARLKDEKDPKTNIIDVSMKICGSFWVTTQRKVWEDNQVKLKDQEFQFEVDKIVMDNRFWYDQSDPSKFELRSKQGNPVGGMVFLDDQNDQDGRPVISPLALWDISWSEDLIDVDKVERIWFFVDGRYRPRDRSIDTNHTVLYHREHSIARKPTAPRSFQLPLPTAPPCKNLASIHDFNHEALRDILHRREHPPVALYGLPRKIFGTRFDIKSTRPASSAGTAGRISNLLFKKFTPPRFDKEAEIRPTFLSAWSPMGADVSSRVDGLAATGNRQTFDGCLRTAVASAAQQLAALPESEGDKTILRSWTASTGQHECGIATMTSLDPQLQNNLKVDEGLCLARIKGVPMGSTLIAPKHVAKIQSLGAFDKFLYLEGNKEEILKDEKDYLDSGATTEGCYFLIGRFGLVVVDKPYYTVQDGWQIVSQTAFTSILHGVSGGNVWITAVKDGKMIQSNYMIGNHDLTAGDVFNSAGGTPLMVSAMDRTPIVLEALHSGKTIQEVVGKKSAEVQKNWARSTRNWNFLDAFGVLLASKRASGSLNQAFEYDTKVIRYKDLGALEADLGDGTLEDRAAEPLPAGSSTENVEPGLYFGDIAFNPLEVVCPGSTEAIQQTIVSSGFDQKHRDLVEKKAAHAFAAAFSDKEFKDQLKEDVQKIIDDLRSELLKREPNLTPIEVKERVQTDLEFDLRVRQALNQRLRSMVQNLYDEVNNDAGFSSASMPDVDQLVSSALDSQVHDKVMKAGGVMEKYTTNYLIKKETDRYTMQDLLEKISSLEAAAQDASKRLVAAKELRQRFETPADAAELEMWEKANEHVLELQEEKDRNDKELEGLKDIEGYHNDPTEADKKFEGEEKTEEKKLEKV